MGEEVTAERKSIINMLTATQILYILGATILILWFNKNL